MRDVVFIAVILGFFSVAALFVAVCDRIVGPDPIDGAGERDAPSEPAELVPT